MNTSPPSPADETPAIGSACTTCGSLAITADGVELPVISPASGVAKILARENTERMVFVAVIVIALVALGVAPLVAVSAAAGGLGAVEAHRRWGTK